jgi:hypothetical protein
MLQSEAEAAVSAASASQFNQFITRKVTNSPFLFFSISHFFFILFSFFVQMPKAKINAKEDKKRDAQDAGMDPVAEGSPGLKLMLTMPTANLQMDPEAEGNPEAELMLPTVTLQQAATTSPKENGIRTPMVEEKKDEDDEDEDDEDDDEDDGKSSVAESEMKPDYDYSDLPDLLSNSHSHVVIDLTNDTTTDDDDDDDDVDVDDDDYDEYDVMPPLIYNLTGLIVVEID